MMASVAATSRQLKNKETNVDMYVPSFVEIPGSLLTATVYEYSLVVVSSLPAYKSKTHGFKDTVQFVVKKRYSDFEALRAQLDAKYGATILPSLPSKRTILADDKNTAAERLAACDRLARAVARDPKLCACSIVLGFLGVTLMGAGLARTGDNEATLDMDDVYLPGTQTDHHDVSASIQVHQLSNFLDENTESSDLFAVDGDNSLDGSDDVGNREQVKDFDPVLSSTGMARSDALQMFARLNLDNPAPDATGSAAAAISRQKLFEEEDDSNSDLLRVNDLDDLLGLLTKKPPSSTNAAVPSVALTEKKKPGPVQPNVLNFSSELEFSAPVLESMASNDILRYIADHNVRIDHDDEDDLFS